MPLFMPVLYLRHRSLLPQLLCRSSPVTRPLPQVSLHSNLFTISRLLSASSHTTSLTSPAISQQLLPHLCHTTSLFLPIRPYTLPSFPSIPRLLPPTFTTACPLLLLLVSTRPISGCRPCPLCSLLSCIAAAPSPPLPLSPPLSHSQESRVPVAASCTQTDLTFVENPFSSQLPHQLTTAQDYPLFSANRQLPMLPPRTQQQQEEEVYSHIQLPVAPSVQRSAAGFTSDRRLRVSPLQKKSPLFDQVKERIYSEAASLVSENETHPYYLMELLRAAQLLGSITFSAYKYNSILF